MFSFFRGLIGRNLINHSCRNSILSFPMDRGGVGVVCKAATFILSEGLGWIFPCSWTEWRKWAGIIFSIRTVSTIFPQSNHHPLLLDIQALSIFQFPFQADHCQLFSIQRYRNMHVLKSFRGKGLARKILALLISLFQLIYEGRDQNYWEYRGYSVSPPVITILIGLGSL